MAKKKTTKKDIDQDLIQMLAFGGFVQNLFGGKTPNDPMVDEYLRDYQNLSSRPNYIKSPEESLVGHDMRLARAEREANNNSWGRGLDILGSLAMQTGSAMISRGASGSYSEGEGGTSPNSFSSFLSSIMGSSKEPGKENRAFGGNIGKKKVEVEGNEMGETPGGTLLDFQGPSHEEGGIEMILPEGTAIYSDRIKIDNKTMAERKKEREKKVEKLNKRLESNPYDTILNNTNKRLLEVTEAEDAHDMELQNNINRMLEQEAAEDDGKFLTGGTVGGEPFNWMDIIRNIENFTNSPVPSFTGSSADYHDENRFGEPVYGLETDNLETGSEAVVSSSGEERPSFLDTISDFFKGGNSASLPTFGDALGMYSNVKQARDLKDLTLKNRATSTPNVNAFRDFGKQSLKTIDDSVKYINQVRDENLRELALGRNAASKKARRNARSLNTQRAMDIAIDNNMNSSMSDIYSNFASQMLGILSGRSQLEASIDSQVMSGEQSRDLADRQDRGAFYTNIAQNTKDNNLAMSSIAKSLNDLKGRGVNQNILNSMADYVNVNVMNGNISLKDGINMLGGSNTTKLARFNQMEGWKELGYASAEEWNKLPKNEQLQLMLKHTSNA